MKVSSGIGEGIEDALVVGAAEAVVVGDGAVVGVRVEDAYERAGGADLFGATDVIEGGLRDGVDCGSHWSEC